MRFMRICSVFISTLVGACAPLAGQAHWDESTHSYLVTVPTGNGATAEMRVVPPNRVRATLTARVVAEDSGSLTYRYTIYHLPTSPQGLGDIHVPCPTGANIKALVGGDWNVWSGWDTGVYCEFYGGLAAIGDTGHVRFNATLLPDTGMIILRGGTGGFAWPTDDPTSETDRLKPLVDSLSGTSENGLVARIIGIVPSHAVALVASASTGPGILTSALAHVCQSTDWISSTATCGELAAEIGQVNTALVTAAPQGAPRSVSAVNTAKQALTAFLQTLDAGHGSTINDNAFAMLRILAKTLKDAL